MGVGLQVFNDQATVQFDSEAPAYAYVGKGTITTSASDTNTFNSWNLAYLENMPSFDTIAISCRDGAVMAGGIGFPESTSYLFQTDGGPPRTITYYLFRSYAKLPSISGAGFESYTGDGRLSYSTAYRPLAVVARHPVTSMYASMSEGRGLPAGREHAFIAYGNVVRDMGNGGVGGETADVPDVSFNGASAGVRLVDGGYYVEEVRGNGFYWGNAINGGFLVADVTGL